MREPVRLSPVDSLVALAKGMWVTLRHVISRPDVTIEYPFEKRQPFPRNHGRHILNRYPNGMEKCIGCELCAGACPADAILVWGAPNPPEAPISPGERYGAVYQINMLRCIFCGLCVEACPTDAITMTTFFEFTGPSRSGLIYDKEELLRLPPGPEEEKFGYSGEPAMLPLSETEQPGSGSLHGGEGEPVPTGTEVPVVWLPGETWRAPSEPEPYRSPGEMKT